MALYNIVCAVTETLGISDVVIGAAVSGYKNFADVPNGAVVSYGIRERESAHSEVEQTEVGTGTWNSGTLTLSRTVTDSTNAGSKIILATGYAEVYITPLAADFHNPVTIGTASGLSLAAQVLSLGLASAGVTGALSGTDWTTFNNKQNALGFTPVNIASADWIDLTDGGATTLHSHAGGGGTWGSITGTLSNQTDLQAALNSKEPTITILAASKGGTGIANGASASLTLPNLAITLGGGGAAQTYTLPAAGGTFALLNAANVFTAAQMIDGTADAVQLRVQGHSTQTTNLQTWELSTGAVVASVSGSGVFSTNNINNTQLDFISTNSSGTGLLFDVYANSGSPANTDTLFNLRVFGNNVTPTKKQFGSLRMTMDDITSGSEDSSWVMSQMSAGTLRDVLTVSPTSIVYTGKLAVGAGAVTPTYGLEVNVTSDATIALFKSTNASANGGLIQFETASGTPAINDLLFRFNFVGKDSGANDHTYAQQVVNLTNVTHTTEAAKVQFYASVAGILTEVFTLNDNSTVKARQAVDTTENYQVDGTQVVTNRVIDARIDDAINSGDATTDGVIDAIRDALITHGLIAAA